MTKTLPTVAVINSSEDTIEMVRTCLEHHGLKSVVTAHVTDVRKGRVDFAEFLSRHDPRVLVYDISIPYEDNWHFLQSLLKMEQMEGRRIVITTTNKKVLESLVGPNDAFEIHGKPYDIQAVAAAVVRAAAGS